ncbi:MAG TPA: alpha/beta hydrolase [Bryobacteraceae bacterium]|jgi:alpha-L-fucosidase 2|nr:alpha/beta hydrolase [Bryobacteraceae bacterium]
MYARLWAACAFVLLMSTTLNAAVSFETRRDIEYSHPDGIGLRMDASIPGRGAAVPAAILVHGGGWVRGDRRVEVEPLFQPLKDAGLAWFSIDYRPVSDLTRLGCGIDDVLAALQYVRAHATEFGIDPHRIALIGESAGGQLAASAALRLSSEDAVQAVVAFYAPTDLVKLAKTSKFIPAQIRNAIEGTPWEGLFLKQLASLSPVENVRPGMPPLLLIHGTADPLVPFEQSVEMCRRVKQVAGSCQVYALNGAGHGLRWWPARYQSYQQVMTDWLHKQLGTRTESTD